MINLIPPDEKRQISYARRNVKLIKWGIAALVGIFGVLIIVGFGILYINQNTNSIARQAKETEEQLKVQKLDETKQKVSEISSSLKLVISVLSKEVLFSRLMKQIGAATPSGAALTSLNISKIEGGIDLQFGATDYQTASQVQVNLQDPANGIFDKADILNINCSNTASAESSYPCTVTIRSLFTKNNPFLFINSKATTAVVKP